MPDDSGPPCKGRSPRNKYFLQPYGQTSKILPVAPPQKKIGGASANPIVMSLNPVFQGNDDLPLLFNNTSSKDDIVITTKGNVRYKTGKDL